MKIILIGAAVWLLLNVLYVLIVIPSRKGQLPKQLARVTGAIRKLTGGRWPPLNRSDPPP
ncbi:hypothetical protein QRQ56_25265 [Bradyrhizobium sp. U531]|uniref:hypothetical protein n=1 Tax=Bradyrhizobium sp. U531 TaxID=3053458 RepID=UPI003F43D0F9